MTIHIPRFRICGDGQLGAMMVPYAHQLGLKPVILGPSRNSPGGLVADMVIGDYRDVDEVFEFGLFGLKGGFVTFEFEDVNYRGLSSLEKAGVIVRPSSNVLTMVKDKFRQKELVRSVAGLPTAEYGSVVEIADIDKIASRVGYPVVLKQRLGSYDGKGNAVITDKAGIAVPFAEMRARSDLYVESFVPFSRELAQVLTRGHDGDIVYYPLVETRQTNGGICDVVVGPVLQPHLVHRAQEIGRIIAEVLGHVGTLAIELFEVDGDLIVNELAPRVHNSGHWSIEGAHTCQFENHVRAVVGWPLGSINATN